MIYESYIYHVDINYSAITSLHITPAIHSRQQTKQFPPPRTANPDAGLSARARMTFNRDFSQEIKNKKGERDGGGGGIPQLIRMQ